MVILTQNEALVAPINFCDKCGTEEGGKQHELSLKSNKPLVLCFCNSLVRKRRQSKRRNTTADRLQIQYVQNQTNLISRRTSLPARINIMGSLESKGIEGNQTPNTHRKLLRDPRSPTTGIDRTPISVENGMDNARVGSEIDLCSTPVKKTDYFVDPRSPNCPRTPIPLSDPRSPCETVARTPIFLKYSTEKESDSTDTFVFNVKQTPSPPTIEVTNDTVQTTVVSLNKEIAAITEGFKQISTPEYDDVLATLERTNTKKDVIYRDEQTDKNELPKKPKTNRPSLKKINKKKIQELSQGQQRSPLATRNHHSDSPVFTNKTRTYVRLDRNGGEFRKRQNSLGSTGTRLSAKFEIFTEKENV